MAFVRYAALLAAVCAVGFLALPVRAGSGLDMNDLSAVQSVPRGLPRRNVLLTGFGPFMQYKINPSELVARALNDTCVTVPMHGVEVCFESWVLPVNATGSSCVQRYVEGGGVIRWDAIVHMGLEDDARGLKLETIGANIRVEAPAIGEGMEEGESTYVPSALTMAKAGAGARAGGPNAIVPGGPDVLPTTANLRALNLPEIFDNLGTVGAALQASEGTGTAWSRDAGSFYCNETLYRTLHTLRYTLGAGEGLIPAMFVHLPNLKTLDTPAGARLVSTVAAALAA